MADDGSIRAENNIYVLVGQFDFAQTLNCFGWTKNMQSCKNINQIIS